MKRIIVGVVAAALSVVGVAATNQTALAVDVDCFPQGTSKSYSTNCWNHHGSVSYRAKLVCRNSAGATVNHYGPTRSSNRNNGYNGGYSTAYCWTGYSRVSGSSQWWV